MQRLAYTAGCALALILLTGCGDEDPHRAISVSGQTVRAGETLCSGLTREKLRACGLSPSETARALELQLGRLKSRLEQQTREPQVDEDNLLWMARLMMGEARSEYGMQLVGNVAIQRSKGNCWPSGVEPVIREDWQFTAIQRNDRGVLSFTLEDYDNQRLSRPVLNKWRRAVRAAHGTLSLPDSLLPPVAHGYANLNKTRRRPWMDKWQRVYDQGEHTFFRHPSCGRPVAAASAR